MTSKGNWENFAIRRVDEASFLELPMHIKEHICRFLTKPADKLEACLIHSRWSIAAQKVLWEKPRMRLPENCRIFFEAINNNNSTKTAFLVKDLQLTFLDPVEDLFEPIAKSNNKRHQQKEVLGPMYFLNAANRCENLTDLTIYGWE
ncbi:hypothetical protein A0J61_05543, partial [Choanephora cucurbitarum]